MKIIFSFPGIECPEREWPCPPRKGDTVSLDGDYPKSIVKEVIWGEHIDPNGNVIIDRPAAVVVLENSTEKEKP